MKAIEQELHVSYVLMRLIYGMELSYWIVISFWIIIDVGEVENDVTIE